ncbi:MAG: NAD(P)/FAD-dependent oxidoreductase, partial [Anaerolineae bacterium]
FTLRTLEDAMQIKAYAADRERAVVVGGGLLGLEAARGLKGMGLDVTIVELFNWLMPMQLDEEGGALLGDFAEGQGYTVLTGTSLKAITGEDEVEGAVLAGGRTLPADMVLIAAGVRPNLTLARKTGLETDRGVTVNDRMETSAPHVYAAGDIASFEGVCWAIVPVAQAQAQVAASNMAGEEASYEPVVPSTSLKVVNIDVNSMGTIDPKEDESFEQIRRSQPDASIYKKIVLHDGRIVGAILINAKALAKDLSSLVEERAKMTPEEAGKLLEA